MPEARRRSKGKGKGVATETAAEKAVVQAAVKADDPAAGGARAFSSSRAFRSWLETHHASATSLWVRCYKVHAAGRGMTYRQAVDEALCFGWIDGVTRRIDGATFGVRFTPRQRRSVWSRLNLKRIGELSAEGRVAAAGQAALAARDEARTGLYSFERAAMSLSPDLDARFKADAAAWKYFNAQPPGYRRTCLFWVMSAKRESTRVRRLGILIDCAARQTRIPLLQPSASNKARTS